MHTLRQRLNARDESGFTLIELLVVLIIIGVLLAIAIPSYLGFQKKAQQTAAMSDVRQAIPDAVAYYSDNNNYTGMTASILQTKYDNGMQITTATGSNPGIVTAGPSSAVTGDYCISAVDAGHWAHVVGPGGNVVNDDNDSGGAATSDPCPAATS
jgi:prepilin-type N-terminal cleavage/methylation domain-containing protein